MGSLHTPGEPAAGGLVLAWRVVFLAGVEGIRRAVAVFPSGVPLSPVYRLPVPWMRRDPGGRGPLKGAFGGGASAKPAGKRGVAVAGGVERGAVCPILS